MDCNLNRQLLAGWVSSPIAASEQSSSLKTVLADRPLSGSHYGLYWAQTTHSPVKEPALQVAYNLNVGNQRDTGHSARPAPPAAMV